MAEATPPDEGETVTGGGGIGLHVDVTGPVDGKPILFVHGFCGSTLVWEKQMHSGLANDFRLVAVDLRGHGRSEKPTDAYGESELWAADIQAVIDELSLESPVVVSWSVGSGWLSDYLKVHGDDAIAGVNLVGPRIPLRDEDPSEVFGEKMLRLITEGVFTSTDVSETITGLEKFVSLWTAQPLEPKEHVFMFGTVAVVPPYVRAGQLARTGTIAYDNILVGLEAPVLISHGDADEVILPTVADSLAEIIPNTRTSIFPGVGHMPFHENPARFNRELREFVEGLGRQ